MPFSLALSRSSSRPLSHSMAEGVARKLSSRFVSCKLCEMYKNAEHMPITQLQKCRGAKMRPLLRGTAQVKVDEEGCHAPRPSATRTWMPERLPGTSLKCANAKRHLHLHTKCKRNSTRALTSVKEGGGVAGPELGLWQLEGVQWSAG